jgi:phosphoribosylaminoimidazolecarboxamide formyltransferase/IMP cyclohydrolase
LRYGENSHQSAVAYKEFGVENSLAEMEVLHGKALSFNNMVDIAGAVYSVSTLDDFACSVVKHNNPCGLAQSKDIHKVLELAWEGDPISAFGSIIAFNHPVDKAALAYLNLDDKATRKFVEVVIAPEFSEAALAYLTSRKNLRVIQYDPKTYTPNKDVRHFHGLWLVQDPDTKLHDGLSIM